MQMLKKILLIIGFGFLLASCSEEDNLNPYPCLDGECNAYFEIDPLVSPGVYQDENGYWHIEHQGYNYFTIQGQLDILHPDYEINGVPLVETIYDSNYWVWIDGLTFTVPLYSLLGYFTSGDWQNPIPVGTLTYTITDMANNFPPLNIVGYSFNPNSENNTIGTFSKYNYEPRQQIFFDTQMVGDTAKVFVRAVFPQDIEIDKEFNIIFE
jgi:hypothetical protein|tara:strand:+ start:14 stop:643 length:630 start_codon:yes stop_codon:yes gene_type:complete